jgi:predicted Zn-dependent peptidase
MESGLFQVATFGKLRVHVLTTDQFKTTTLSLYAGVPMREQTVTPVSLIAHVMRRVSARYPRPEMLKQKLEELYGAIFAVDVDKRGNYQIVDATIDVVADEYVSCESERSLLSEAIRFLMDGFAHPAFDENGFDPQFVAEEKRSIEQKLLAIKNDKANYAGKRCVEEMCESHPYRFSAHGILEHLEQWDGTNLAHFYRQWLNECVFDLFVVGNIEMKTILQLLAEIDTPIFAITDKPIHNYVVAIPLSANQQEKHVEEQMDVGQGKLNIGLKTTITPAHPDYPMMQVYNGVLGGFAHSKLFTNVREKHSLAYYASSGPIDGVLGIYIIQAGIDIEKKEQTIEIIREQLNEMRLGNISELELQQTKALLNHSYRSMTDSPYELISYGFRQRFTGSLRTPAEWLDILNRTTIADIQRVAQTVVIDTVYFLRGVK